MRIHMNSRHQHGFSILEIMIGIFIFVVGLLALSSLQGALTRAMADAKVRTTAANIAERTIEESRGFSRIESDTVNPKGWFAYNDIVSADTTEVVNGVTYSIDLDVIDHYYNIAGDNFTTTAPPAHWLPLINRSRSRFPGAPRRISAPSRVRISRPPTSAVVKSC